MVAIGFGCVLRLNASQPFLTTNGRCVSWKNKNLGKLRASGQLHFCRARIVTGFWATISRQWFTCSFKKHLGQFRQANCWSQLSPSGTAPIARSGHTSVWSDVADGMYVFGGYNGTRRGLSVSGLTCGGRRHSTPRYSTASLRRPSQ